MGRMLLWPDDGVAVHCEECRAEALSVELRDEAGCWDAGDRRGRVMGGEGTGVAWYWQVRGCVLVLQA